MISTDKPFSLLPSFPLNIQRLRFSPNLLSRILLEPTTFFVNVFFLRYFQTTKPGKVFSILLFPSVLTLMWHWIDWRRVYSFEAFNRKESKSKIERSRESWLACGGVARNIAAYCTCNSTARTPCVSIGIIWLWTTFWIVHSLKLENLKLRQLIKNNKA